MQSDGKNVELGLRLKLENGKITEAEHIVVATVRDTSVAKLQKPRMQLVTPVTDDAYRDARGRLLHIAATYYDALDNNNGSLAPFADDCVRMENGMQTVRNPVPADPSQGFGLAGALGCAKQLDTNTFEYIDRIENRRVWIADEENGVADRLLALPSSDDEARVRGLRHPRADGAQDAGPEALRHAGRAHLQDLGRPDSRDRSGRRRRALQLAHGLGITPQDARRWNRKIELVTVTSAISPSLPSRCTSDSAEASFRNRPCIRRSM